MAAMVAVSSSVACGVSVSAAPAATSSKTVAAQAAPLRQAKLVSELPKAHVLVVDSQVFCLLCAPELTQLHTIWKMGNFICVS